MSRTFAIGDIHGCSLALRTLLAEIAPQPQDTVLVLGDYVDRGPDSCGVIEQMLEWRAKCNLITMMGNHEQMMLAAIREPSEWQFWMQFGGRQTLESYGGKKEGVPDEHWEFLRTLRPYYETETHFFVHANYEPRVALDRQTDHFRYWLHVEFPPQPHITGKRAIVGHTAQRSGEVLNYENLLCIDTFCHGTGWLTALEVETDRIWQVNKNGKRRFKSPQVVPPASDAE